MFKKSPKSFSKVLFLEVATSQTLKIWENTCSSLGTCLETSEHVELQNVNIFNRLLLMNGSWLKAHGSCLKARGSALMAHGRENFGAGAWGLGGPAPNFAWP